MINKGFQLAEYISSIEDFRIPKISQGLPVYQHIGAITVDAVLQAGMNYKSVVWPRVKNVLDSYPHARTTTAFLQVIDEHGIHVVTNWKHPEKPRRVLALLTIWVETSVETVSDLQQWLLNIENSSRLLTIKGVGYKTVDYIKNLIGLSSVAIDRHIIKFIQSAGIRCLNYRDYYETVSIAASLLNVSQRELDKAIWEFCAYKPNSSERC